MRTTLLALLLIVCAASIVRAQDLLLNNGRIVDPATRQVTTGSIVIRGGVIAGVLPDAPTTFDGRVIDLDGKWVIPGLNDMHVHSFGNVAPGNQMQLLGTEESARMMLFTGVTGFLDLFMAEDQIIGLRDKQRSGGASGADIYCAGPIITCPGGHGTEYGIPTRVVKSAAEAEKEVTELAAKRPDVVKLVYDHAFVMPSMDKETMTAVVATAKRHKLKTVVHIGTWSDAREAIEAGADCITHVYFKEEIPDDLVTLMREKGVYQIPTMAVQNDLANLMRDRSITARPLLKAVTTPEILAAYGDSARLDPRTKVWLAAQLRGEESLYRSVRKMIDGGVKVLAGTDVGNPGTFQGYSLHRELQLLVKAGMTPWGALASATTLAGEFLGAPFGFKEGSVANLVVLDASPIEDIMNTEKIAMVIHHGVVVDREEILNPKSLAWTKPLLDDFSNADLLSSAGGRWSVDLDTAWGGKSTLRTEWKKGMLRVHGKVAPGRGMPGMAGISLYFGEENRQFDVSAFDGVRLRVKAPKGGLALKLVTAGVKNYDYHAAVIEAKPGLQTLEIPFADFRQLWSRPMAWTGRDMRGVALWVSGMTPADYDFTIDSIELYKKNR